MISKAKATPAVLGSGTFRLNNSGVFERDGLAAIINHPEAVTLGVGRIFDNPWAVYGELAVHKVKGLTLTFDHSVSDGGTVAGCVVEVMASPASNLADM